MLPSLYDDSKGKAAYGDSIMKKYLILLLSAFIFPNIVNAQVVTVSGHGVDKDSAFKDAVRTAVEQVVGVYINSNTIVSNAQVELDKIYTASEGYVNSFSIINEGYRNNEYQMLIKVDVDTKPDSELMNRLNMIFLLNNPKIVVQVTGTKYAGICEAAVTSKLKNMGLQVLAEHNTLSLEEPVLDVVDIPVVFTESTNDESEGADGEDKEGSAEDSSMENPDSEGAPEDFSNNEDEPEGDSEVKPSDDEQNPTESSITAQNILTPSVKRGSLPSLSSLEGASFENGDYTVRCILTETTMNVTLPVFDVAGKRPNNSVQDTGLLKAVVNANVDVVKNEDNSVIQQFYLTENKIYNNADIAIQTAMEGISYQIADNVAKVFSNHASQVKVMK